jgi:heme-degrading monooxygenase HmoA
MISRQWRGLAKVAHAQEYVEHLKTDTFPQIRRIPGFVDASILKRKVARGVESLVVTRWQSLEAIRAFAVRHYEVLE